MNTLPVDVLLRGQEARIVLTSAPSNGTDPVIGPLDVSGFNGFSCQIIETGGTIAFEQSADSETWSNILVSSASVQDSVYTSASWGVGSVVQAPLTQRYLRVSSAVEDVVIALTLSRHYVASPASSLIKLDTLPLQTERIWYFDGATFDEADDNTVLSQLDLNPGHGSMRAHKVTLQVDGTFEATLKLQGTQSEAEWYDISVYKMDGTDATVRQNGITASGLYGADLWGGVYSLRLKCTDYTSGSATVFAKASK